jgi:aryl-alcohol dehydrogenase-like predicted oxidoreductase
MLESAFLPEVLAAAQKIKQHAMARGMTATDFALAWLLAHKCVSSVLVGARNGEQLAGYLSALDHELGEADEAVVDAIVSPGHHASPGYNDPLYPVTGRQAVPI